MASPERTVEANVKRFREELVRTIRRIAAEFKASLADAERDERGRLVPRNGRNAAILRAALREMLRDFRALFGDARELYAEMQIAQTRAVIDDFDEADRAQLSSVARSQLVAQRNGAWDELESFRNNAQAELREAVADALANPIRPSSLVERVAERLATSVSRATSLVDTSLMGADRIASVEGAAGAGFEFFLYDGPVDQLTRAWCRQRVGRVFTREEMDDTPNDTGPNPPSVYGGGYNCRHRWVPVSSEDVRRGRYRRFRGR